MRKAYSLNTATVRILPDMITFTHDGNKVITANEGEPDTDYLIDPPGSVSVIDISNGVNNAILTQIEFTPFDGQENALRASGIRIFGINASASRILSRNILLFRKMIRWHGLL